MNPFNDDNESDNESDDYENISNRIEIRIESRGKRKNTYMTGWKLELNEQKNHLKKLRKMLSCSGSCKMVDIDNTDKKKILFHLQGDHIDKLKSYLLDNGVKDEDISVKGG